jgi:hypothetical protein
MRMDVLFEAEFTHTARDTLKKKRVCWYIGSPPVVLRIERRQGEVDIEFLDYQAMPIK